MNLVFVVAWDEERRTETLRVFHQPADATVHAAKHGWKNPRFYFTNLVMTYGRREEDFIDWINETLMPIVKKEKVIVRGRLANTKRS